MNAAARARRDHRSPPGADLDAATAPAGRAEAGRAEAGRDQGGRSLDGYPVAGLNRTPPGRDPTGSDDRPPPVLHRLRRSVAGSGGAGPAAVIRRVPVASFNGLGVYLPGTAIPAYYFQPRPPWLRGQANSAATVRIDVSAHRRSMNVPSPIFGEPPVVAYQCVLCGRWSPIEQLSVDHVIDWQEYCDDAIQANDRQLFEQRYHDLDNLHLVHNNCNASKNARELFSWWLARQPADPRFNPGAVARIQGALTRLYELHGVDFVDEIPAAQRLQVVSGIVQQSSVNAFEHLMGNARITTAMGGWNLGANPPVPGNDDMDLGDN